MEHFFAHNIYTLTFVPVGFLFLYFLVCISDKDITRVGVFMWGVILIGIAGITAYQLMGWHPVAQMLVDSKNGKGITRATFEDFEQKSAFLLWFIPFFTGALGTNLISDALTKPLLYKKEFSWFELLSNLSLFGKAIVWIPIISVLAPALILYGSMRALWDLRNFPKRWRTYAKHYRNNYLRANMRAKFPWE